MASIFVIFSKDCSFLVLLASLLFHRCVMPRAHDDCKFRDEWLVQDKYKDWVVKDGDPRLARCQFCMKSSNLNPIFEKVIDGELVFEVKSLS